MADSDGPGSPGEPSPIFDAVGVLQLGGPSEEDLLLAAARAQRQALRRLYAKALAALGPWCVSVNGAEVRLSEAIELSDLVSTAIFMGKCRDQNLEPTDVRRRRFADMLLRSASGPWLRLEDSGVGKECCRGVAVALLETERFSSLELGKNAIGDEGAATLAKVLPLARTLAYCDLSANDIGPTGGRLLMEALVKNESIVTFCFSSLPGLHRNSLGAAGAEPLAQVLQTNKVLTKLVLACNSIGEEGCRYVAAGLYGNGTLLELDLSGNDLGWQGFDALGRVIPTTRLEVLELRDNKAGDRGAAMLLAPWAEQPDLSLEVLGLGGNDMSGHGANSVYEFLGWSRNIRDIRLDHNLIHAEKLPAQLAHGLQESPSLRRLNFSFCHLRSRFIAELFRALDKASLEVLVLRGNTFDQSVAAALASHVSATKTLKLLDASACHISDAAGALLGKGFEDNGSVEVLDLRDNGMQDGAGTAIAAALAQNTTLVRVRLDLNSIDCRHLAACHAAVQRNAAARARAQPKALRQRIRGLRQAQREAVRLTEESEKNKGVLVELTAQRDAAQRLYEQTLQEKHREMDQAARDVEAVRAAKLRTEAGVAALKEQNKQAKLAGDREERVLQGEISRLEASIQSLGAFVRGQEEKALALEQEAAAELEQLQAAKARCENAREAEEQLYSRAKRTLESFEASDAPGGAGAPAGSSPAGKAAARPQSAQGKAAAKPQTPQGKAAARPQTPQGKAAARPQTPQGKAAASPRKKPGK